MKQSVSDQEGNPLIPLYKDQPTHWVIKRLKWSASGIYNGIWGDEPNGEEDIICVRVADFDRIANRVVDQPPTIRAVEEKFLENRKLESGDLLIEKSGGGENQLVGCVVSFDHQLDATCSNFVSRIKSAVGVRSRYFVYVHAALYAARFNFPAIKQTTGIQNLDTEAYFNIKIAFPPEEEQGFIAYYLDRETTHIDALIAEKERMLALLEEKRAALISQAVTRGLNPDVPLKASDARWFDLVPQHWSVERLKWVVASISSGVSVNASDQPADGEAFGVLKTSAVAGGNFKPVENKSVWNTEYDRLACPVTAHSIIMSRMNTPVLVGESGYVDQDYPSLFLPDRLWKITFDEQRVDVQFMALVLSSKEARHALSSMATGTSPSMKNLAQEEMTDLLVPLPGIAEQVEIRDYILSADNRMKTLQDELQNSVILLRELRSALITAAVTGQIDPKDMAA